MVVCCGHAAISVEVEEGGQRWWCAWVSVRIKDERKRDSGGGRKRAKVEIQDPKIMVVFWVFRG